MSKEEKQAHGEQGVCPHCGYCPHCGRSNDRIVYMPMPYPIVQPPTWTPVQPWWRYYQPLYTVTSNGNLNVSDIPGYGNVTVSSLSVTSEA